MIVIYRYATPLASSSFPLAAFAIGYGLQVVMVGLYARAHPIAYLHARFLFTKQLVDLLWRKWRSAGAKMRR